MKILILNYHRVLPKDHIDPETFDFQMQTLKKKFTPLTLDDVLAVQKGEKKFKGKGFAVTFDDGWADNFIYAYPILKKYGIPATIFASTNLIAPSENVRTELTEAKGVSEAILEVVKDGTSQSFLTWSEVGAMKDFVNIESHGETHARHFSSEKKVGVAKFPLGPHESHLLLSGISISEGDALYESSSVLASRRYDVKKNELESEGASEERIWRELDNSIKKISAYTGRTSRHLAWPFGEWSEMGLRVAKKIGFEACYTTTQGWTRVSDNPLSLKRFSPPKNHHLFKVATHGSCGMSLYLAILHIVRMFRK